MKGWTTLPFPFTENCSNIFYLHKGRGPWMGDTIKKLASLTSTTATGLVDHNQTKIRFQSHCHGMPKQWPPPTPPTTPTPTPTPPTTPTTPPTTTTTTTTVKSPGLEWQSMVTESSVAGAESWWVRFFFLASCPAANWHGKVWKMMLLFFPSSWLGEKWRNICLKGNDPIGDTLTYTHFWPTWLMGGRVY